VKTEQHPLWTRFQKAADDARQRGDLARAEYWLMAAAGVAAEQAPDLLDETMADLRLVYEEGGRHEEAEALAREVGDLDGAAVSMARRGAHGDAEEALRGLLAKDEAAGDRDGLLAHLLGLARVQHDGGRYAAAEESLQRLGDQGVDVDELRARLYEDQGRYAEAREAFERVLARSDGLERRARLARVLHVAMLDMLTDRGDDAEALLLECLDHLEHDDASMLMVHTLQSLGTLAEASGAVFEAEGFYHELLERRLSPSVGASLRAAMARVLVAQERPEEGLRMAERALGSTDLDALTRASVHEARARAQEALGRDASSARRERDMAVAAWHASEVDRHPDEARALDQQALALRGAGYDDLASLAAGRAAEIRATSPGRARRPFLL